MPVCPSAFKPAWWLPGPHLQTIWPYLFRRRLQLPLIHERLELPDGDFVDLAKTATDHNQSHNPSSPIIAVFHGLEGSINSHYAKPMLAALQQRGWPAVFMHFRGCSGEHNRLQRGYHSGDTGDIAFLLDTLRARFPGRRLAAIGYSLGGNALLKYLGEADRSATLSAAAAVSVVYSLADGAQRLDRGLSKHYQRHLLKRISKRLHDKFAHNPPAIDFQNMHTLKNFYAFDDQITAPLHGFASADDYYTHSSSRQYLGKINVPTLLLHAADDPFMSQAGIPTAQALSSKVRLELSVHGGHVGFVAGRWPWRPLYWLEQRIPEFLSQHLSP